MREILRSERKIGKTFVSGLSLETPKDFDHEGRPLSLISHRIGDIDTDIYESAEDNWRENFEMLKQVASEEASGRSVYRRYVAIFL